MKSCSIRGCGAKRGLLPRASASRAAGQAAAAAAEVVTGTGRGRCAGGGGGGGGKSGMTMSARLPQSAAGGARWRWGGLRPRERGGAGGGGADRSSPSTQPRAGSVSGRVLAKAGVAAGRIVPANGCRIWPGEAGLGNGRRERDRYPRSGRRVWQGGS